MMDFYILIFFISCVIFALVVWAKMGLFDNIKYLFKKKKKKYL